MIFNYVNKNNEQSAIIPEQIDNNELNSQNLPSIAEGEMAPNFELKTLDGDHVQLSDYRGKKVIVNFWATWCGPCREEMPAMQDFYDKYVDEVEILAINTTDSEKNVKTVQSFLEEYDFTYPTLLDKGSSVNEAYEVLGLPTTYFVGTDGTIQAPMKVGSMTYEFMEDMIEKIE